MQFLIPRIRGEKGSGGGGDDVRWTFAPASVSAPYGARGATTGQKLNNCTRPRACRACIGSGWFMYSSGFLLRSMCIVDIACVSDANFQHNLCRARRTPLASADFHQLPLPSTDFHC